MIKFDKVTKRYTNQNRTLDNVSFDISEGEFVYLIGPSGAGKTTALRMIIREDLPSSGNIIISDYDVTSMRKRHLPSLRRQIGVIFQDFKLLPALTVEENISFILEVSDKSDAEISETVQYLLNTVGLSKQSNLYPRQLSGGEQQRVAIARAIANDPAIVLADEPTGNLDPAYASQIMDLLHQINDWGTTVVVSTHDPGFVNQNKARVIELESGKLVRDEVGGSYFKGQGQKLSDETSKGKADNEKEKIVEDFNEKEWESLIEKNSETIIYDDEVPTQKKAKQDEKDKASKDVGPKTKEEKSDSKKQSKKPKKNKKKK